MAWTDLTFVSCQTLAASHMNALQGNYATIPFKGVLAKLTGVQSIANNITTQVTWDAVNYDTGGYWDANSAGALYVGGGIARIRIAWGVDWTSDVTANRLVEILKNAAAFVGGRRIHDDATPANNYTKYGNSAVLSVNSGDELVYKAYQLSGGNLNLGGGIGPASVFFGFVVEEGE